MSLVIMMKFYLLSFHYHQEQVVRMVVREQMVQVVLRGQMVHQGLVVHQVLVVHLVHQDDKVLVQLVVVGFMLQVVVQIQQEGHLRVYSLRHLVFYNLQIFVLLKQMLMVYHLMVYSVILVQH